MIFQSCCVVHQSHHAWCGSNSNSYEQFLLSWFLKVAKICHSSEGCQNLPHFCLSMSMVGWWKWVPYFAKPKEPYPIFVSQWHVVPMLQQRILPQVRLPNKLSNFWRGMVSYRPKRPSNTGVQLENVAKTRQRENWTKKTTYQQNIWIVHLHRAAKGSWEY